MMENPLFDAIVIGTGFAGSVTALRLAEEGLKICVLERGRRYQAGDFPIIPEREMIFSDPANPDPGLNDEPYPSLSRIFWQLDQGMWDIRDLSPSAADGVKSGVLAIQGAGYGGGSLVYANVFLRPPAEIFEKMTGVSEQLERIWPQEYSRENLDKYYDLVAYMLEVEPLPASFKEKLRRTRQFANAANEVCNSQNAAFFPPLSVWFDASSTNRWGVKRQACVHCGGCMFGCNTHAKNTLDTNYLHELEKLECVEIRTLSEVTSILKSEDKFVVHYKNHLTSELSEAGQIPPLTAKYVFLCAGSVGSTELMLRNTAAATIDGKASNLPIYNENIGNRFSTNTDEFAAFFDCKSRQDQDLGPTITASACFKPETGNPLDWVIVQDGGVSASIESLLGIFKSPLWLRRNRFREYLGEEPSAGTFLAAKKMPYADLRALMFFMRILTWRKAGTAELTMSYLNRQWSYMPPWVQKIVHDYREEFLTGIADLSFPIIDSLFADALNSVKDINSDVIGQAISDNQERLNRLIDYDNLIGDAIHDKLGRGVLRLAAQGLWGSEASMMRKIAELLLNEVLPGSIAEIVDKATVFTQWALDYRASNHHTLVMLAMGPDSKQGQLLLNSDQKLMADLPHKLDLPERQFQTDIFRSLAKALQAELRTNPIWPVTRRFVTVHPQGGCAMGDDSTCSVTSASGEVHGIENLYIMDAAAFPDSVGVNPASTIAAVAEYKMERFFKQKRDANYNRTTDLIEGPVDKDTREYPRRYQDDLNCTGTISPTEGISVVFEETLEGFWAPECDDPGESREILEQSSHLDSSLKALQQGIQGGSNYIRATLKIQTMGSLEKYVREHKQHVSHMENNSRPISPCPKLKVEGELELRAGIDNFGKLVFELDGKNLRKLTLKVVPEESYVTLFEHRKSRGSGVLDNKKSVVFVYWLKITCDKLNPNIPVLLSGFKIIKNEKGPDLWKDATTLPFRIYVNDVPSADEFDESEWSKWNYIYDYKSASSSAHSVHFAPPRAKCVGQLRLSLENFFETQIPSINVLNVQDDSHKAWVISQFLQFFSSNMSKEYFPKFGSWHQYVKNLIRFEYD